MRISILSLFLLLNCSLFGQSLDLNEYLSLLKKENIQLKQSENKIHLSEENVKVVRAELLPNLNSGLAYRRDFSKAYVYLNESTEGFPDKFRSNFNNNLEGSLLAEQILFAPMITASYKLSKLAQQESELQREDLSKELVHRATLLFMQAVYTNKSIDVLKENKQIAKSQWDKMNTLFEEGFVSEIQVRKTELYYKRTLPALQSAQNSYTAMVNNMKHLIGMPVSKELVLKETASSWIDFIPQEFDPSMNFNSKIQLLNKQVEMSEQQIKINKTLWFPVVKLGLGYAYNASDNKFQFKQDNNLFYGQLQVEIPIISGGKNMAKLRIAKLENKNMQLERESFLLQLHTEIENARLSIQYAKQKIEEENELIQLSEKELSVANEQITLGAITPLEFREIRLELTKAKLGLLNAKLDYRIANLQLQKILQK